MSMDPDDRFNVKKDNTRNNYAGGTKEYEIQSLLKYDIPNSFERNNNANDQIPKTSGGLRVIDVIKQLTKSNELDKAELTKIITSSKPSVHENTNEEIVETSSYTSEKKLAVTNHFQANDKIFIDKDLYKETKSSDIDIDEMKLKNDEKAIFLFNNISNSELENLNHEKVYLSNQDITLEHSNLWASDMSIISVCSKADISCLDPIKSHPDAELSKSSTSKDLFEEKANTDSKLCIKDPPSENTAYHDQEQTDDYESPLTFDYYKRGRVETSLKKLGEMVKKDIENCSKNYFSSAIKSKNEVPGLLKSPSSYHSKQSTRNHHLDTNASDCCLDSSKEFVKTPLSCEKHEVLETSQDSNLKFINDKDTNLNLRHFPAETEANGHVQKLPDVAKNSLSSNLYIRGPVETSPPKEKLKNTTKSTFRIKNKGSLYYLTSDKTTMDVVRSPQLSTNERFKPKLLRCRSVGFICNFCGENFRSKKNFIQHKRQYISFAPSGAYICSRYLKQYCIIRYNSRRKKIQYKCSHCQKKFLGIGDYSRHCNEQICKRKRSYLVSPFVNECMLDNGERGFECFLCQESSTVYADIKFHECIILREKPENCFENLAEMHPDKNNQDEHQCDVCEKSFQGKDNLKEHRKTHREEEKEIFKCKLCGSDFAENTSLESHLKDHASGRRFECKVCLKSYSRLCSYKTHMKDHEAEKRE